MQAKQNNHSTINAQRNLRVIVVLLLVVIAAMLVMWRPWQDAQGRTISVSGQATVMAVPDEFVFHPTYDVKSTDPDVALGMATKKSEELIGGLKQLGIPERKIKTRMSSTTRPLRDGISDETTYTITMIATVNDQASVQKVQDYLSTTAPTGTISPHLQLSDQKRDELGDQAQDKAIKHARAQAEQTARKMGLRVGHVQKVSDGFAFGYPTTWEAMNDNTDRERMLVLHPGENEITYTMTMYFRVGH